MMKHEVIELVRRATEGRMPSLVLRGADLHARTGGDLDVLVPSGQGRAACLMVAQEARAAGWYLGSFRDIGYLASVVLIRPDIGGEDEAIKVDFFSGLEWYGVGSGEFTRRFFSLISQAGKDTVESTKLLAAANFLQKCLIVGTLSDRDWARVKDGGADIEYLVNFVRALKLPLSVQQIKAKGVHGIEQWRLRAATSGNKGSLAVVAWFLRVVGAHITFKLKIGFKSGHILGLSGLDGSGKSTQMDRLLKAYKKAGGVAFELVHLLPSWIPMPHQLVKRKVTATNYTRPYAEAPVQSRFNGLLRLGYYLMAFVLAKLWMQATVCRGTVIVLDRCFADFAADLTRSRIPAFQLPGWLIKLVAPKGTLIYLDAAPATVVQRKGELALDKAVALRTRYVETFRFIDGKVINADAAPPAVFEQLVKQIDAVYFARLSIAASQ